MTYRGNGRTSVLLKPGRLYRYNDYDSIALYTSPLDGSYVFHIRLGDVFTVLEKRYVWERKRTFYKILVAESGFVGWWRSESHDNVYSDFSTFYAERLDFDEE